LEMLLHLTGVEAKELYLSDSAHVETAYYSADATLVVLNNRDVETQSVIATPNGEIVLKLQPMETRLLKL
ncbi:MAG: hypothetical protein J6A48_00480, partial [Clostridia bacterium]|nr:hypothetical protein [Clostridia bacterium]